jgi:RepB DNA-primase from phage plasmid
MADRTREGVERQVSAMGVEVFEVGVFQPDIPGREARMLLRTWDTETLLRSVAWLRHQNTHGANIYIRPHGEHNLSLIDDLKSNALEQMKRSGFEPAVLVETSPLNFQAWLKHPETLGKELSTATARALAEKFGGDRGSADWRHFGRLAGYSNRKPRYQDMTSGLFPFVRIIEASGRVYPEADRFLVTVKAELEREQKERAQIRARLRARPECHQLKAVKPIEAFRANHRYGGDGTRIDLAYAVYALSHQVSEADIAAAIQSRDLSHKGNARRQHDYVQRTIKKAISTAERGR